MKIIGLTGSVASGKNFIAHQFEKMKIPVFDADLAVHQLFAGDLEILLQIQKYFPKAIINNKIDRKKLGAEVFNNYQKLEILEKIIHPKVRNLQEKFIRKSRFQGKKLVILNIPLLFEKGGFKRCDEIICVITPKIIRRERFLKRAKINNSDLSKILEKFDQIDHHQINNYYKKTLADYIIYNGLDKGSAVRQTKKILQNL